jgi:CxxC-x17-CxxC domain-containing protein
MTSPAHKPLPRDMTIFAKTTFRGEEKPFGIKKDDRRRHVYLIGKTGMGKTTMLQNMIIGDINAGNGVAIVDPHGDVADDILDFIPDDRINDVIYFNPADLEFPIAFNVFERVSTEHKYLVASGLVGVFKKIYAESWGPRLEYILRNTLLALLDYPQATLLGILRILVDKKFRNDVIEKIDDPVVKSFWVDEFANYNEKFRTEAIAPIQNKVGQYLSSAIIRNIVGQVKSSFDLRSIMDNKKIMILSLSKGQIGEDNAALMGSMMITKIQLAAMSRANIPEDDRVDFYLYVDEFQNFATESFATILSEARKYRLNLTIAHQYIEQMSEEVQAAVFGNVGTLVVFRIGANDAEELEKEFDPTFLQADLVNIPSHNIYLKMMIDGLTSPGFSAETLPRLDQYRTGNREKVIKISRERYGRPREVVEEKIRRWSGMAFQELTFGENKSFASAEERMRHKMLIRDAEAKGLIAPEEREMFNAVCFTCNKVIKVPFKPDGVRPVYCKECLPAAQSGKDKPRGRGRFGGAPPRNPPEPYPATQHQGFERQAMRDRDRQDRPRSDSRPRYDNRSRFEDRPRPSPRREQSRVPRVSSQGPIAAPTGKPISLREALAPVKKAFQEKAVARAPSAPTPPRPPTVTSRNFSRPNRPGRQSGQLEEGNEVSLG